MYVHEVGESKVQRDAPAGGEAERRVSLLQPLVHGRVEPGVMAELKNEAVRAVRREQREESIEPLQIEPPLARKLEQERSELLLQSVRR